MPRDHTVLSPSSLFSGFVIRGRHNINPWRDAWDQINIHASTVGIATVSTASLWNVAGPSWAMYAGGLSAAFAVASRKANVVGFFAKHIAEDTLPEDHMISRHVRLLAEDAGLNKVPMVCVKDKLSRTGKNVPFAGALGSTNSSMILVSPDIENQVPERALRGVLAHEVEHIRRGDSKTGLTQRLLALPARILSMVTIWSVPLSYVFGYETPSWRNIGIVLGAKFTIDAMKAWSSRAQERRADRGAVNLTKNPWALANGLKRIIELHKISLFRKNKDVDPNKRGIFASIFHTHPTPKFRIKRLERDMAARVQKDFPQRAERLRRITETEEREFEEARSDHSKLKRAFGRIADGVFDFKALAELVATLAGVTKIKNPFPRGSFVANALDDFGMLLGANWMRPKETRKLDNQVLIMIDPQQPIKSEVKRVVEAKISGSFDKAMGDEEVGNAAAKVLSSSDLDGGQPS